MNDMKKLIIFLVCAVLLISAARVVSLNYQDRPEDFAKLQEWIDKGKKKVKEVTGQLSTQIGEQNWELEGNYDIDTENWFEEEVEIYNGTKPYSKLSSGQVDHFFLQAAGCKVILEVTEETDFYFSFENMKKVQAYQKENSLFIKGVRDTLLNEEKEESRLRLYIPDSCILESANLELGAGILQADNLNTGKLEMSVGAGKLSIASLEADELQVSVGAGTVSLENVNVHNAKISVGAGSMSMDGLITGNVDGECAMGNFELNLQGSAKDFNYDLQCMAGNILLNGEKHSGINEGMVIGNAAYKSMELNCAMGNMKITFVE